MRNFISANRKGVWQGEKLKGVSMYNFSFMNKKNNFILKILLKFNNNCNNTYDHIKKKLIQINKD